MPKLVKKVKGNRLYKMALVVHNERASMGTGRGKARSEPGRVEARRQQPFAGSPRSMA